MTVLNQKPKQKIKVLHVVGQMGNRGGLESWIMQMLRHIDRDRFQIDLMVHVTDDFPFFDAELDSLGVKIVRCLYPQKPWLFANNFKQALQEHGSYDIIHSHLHQFSGYLLRLAHQQKIRHRIVQTHSDTSPLDRQAPWYRQIYFGLMRYWLNRYTTFGVGVSRKALKALLGNENWQSDPRWQVLYCGIDLELFRQPLDRLSVRSEFGIPIDAFVIGHVGRFVPLKNHELMLKILVKVLEKEPNTYLLFVGDGPLRQAIATKALEMGIDSNVMFAGSQDQVPRIMQGAMDVLMLPSSFEGLPLVGLEAQAAGLPVILSDVVTEEVDEIKTLIQRINLSEPIAIWVDAVLNSRQIKQQHTQADCLAILEKSPFNIIQNVKYLQDLYLKLMAIPA
ncbi:glycosyltransferase [Pseudanabaena sp. SR411]|uniref:glycosyltransferase n=1 Tax=Pseudanabaena sp. SR411 TaxID=1980935 RepID=UPI000B989C8C|nr:glycosyltransferase [Pseudanabaena sp. SR411]OYQ63068.1 glycosyltransferase [Pseudanabaena sp. SR411]